MKDGESHISAAGLISDPEQYCVEEEAQEVTEQRRKSVENLLLSSHELIGSSISSMTLPTTPCPSGHPNSLDPRSSPSSSPQASPRPSPRQQHKRDSSRGDISVGSYKEASLLERPESAEDSLSRTSESSHPFELNRSASHESAKERKESRGSDRVKKKSSWYNALYPTYKSRSEDFRRIFKDVPPEERLIVDYSCALQKDILVQGRLYVSQNYLCFYANIFRWETVVCLKWKDVTAITKEKTALVIPNAVLVCTEGEKMFFTSFGARDKTYLMLFRVWQNALMDQQMSMQEMWQWVHTCYGDELGLTSDDEDYIPPASEDDKSQTGVRLSVDSFGEDFSLDQLTPLDCLPEDGPLLLPSSATTNLLSENLPTDMSDTTESDIEKQPGKKQVAECTSQHEGRKVMRGTFPIHVDQLFTLFFTGSKFFLDFHSVRRTSDINMSPWQPNPETGLKQRVVSLTMPLNQSVGPKSTSVCETQVMLQCSKPGQLYAIDCESVNSGIPYADSFYLCTHYCLTKTAENECSFAVYCQIKYKKTVWGIVKSFIEKNTWSALEEFYTSLFSALQLECDHTMGAGIKQKVRRRRRGISNGTSSIMSPSRPLMRLAENDGRNVTEMLSWVVLAILVFLVCLNALLYYKLWVLEEWTQNSSHSFTVMDLQVLRNPPKTHEEWLRLLQQQEALHNVEMQKWQKVLQAAVQLLRQEEQDAYKQLDVVDSDDQTEESLSELQLSIHPLVSKKVLAVLKDTFADAASQAEHSRAGREDVETAPEEEL
ncbi:protein Aster-B-like isoform X2 [Bacillus rossius redtenbacheri]|uniref:protein Aster-B-like isoform X2 n=1 Tax=Bacillus rossius redtenbacheri TaxID=93214 RepID=UPI002FDE4F32